ncbi:putative PilT protein domain protein [Streptomyces sp. Tu6071]|nr:putative PilT protein domain protein [Streptomyces sp. Tu6071]
MTGVLQRYVTSGAAPAHERRPPVRPPHRAPPHPHPHTPPPRWGASGASPLVRHRRASDGDDGEESVQSLEVVGVGGEERKSLRHGDGSDHQVGHPATGLAARADHRGADPAVDAGGLRVERDGVELVLGTLEHIEAPGALGVFVVVALFLVAADLVGARGQLRQGDRCDRHLVRQLFGRDPFPQDHDVRVEEPLREGRAVTGHRGRPGRCRRWSPDRP